MIENSHTKAGNSFLVTLAAFVVVVAGLRAAQEIVVPILLAAFLAVISLPALDWFQRKGAPTWLALVAITFLVVMVGLIIVGVIGSSIYELRLQLPGYEERLSTFEAKLADWLEERNIDPGFVTDLEHFDSERGLSLFGSLLGALGSVLNNALIIVFLLVFMQLEAAELPAKLRDIAPGNLEIANRLQRIRDGVWHYVRLKTRISLLTGLLVTGWLWLAGVDFPMLWGLLAFLFNFVPNIGSIIAAVPAVAVALLQPEIRGQPPEVAQSLLLALYTAAGYLVINLVIGNIIEPRWLGRGVGLSPLVVFLSLVFWGWVLGPVGMVLSVPLTMIAQIALENSAGLRWVAILLAADVPDVPPRSAEESGAVNRS